MTQHPDPLLLFDSEAVEGPPPDTPPASLQESAHGHESRTPSNDPRQRRSSDVRIWTAATVSIVLGLLIGFASGYRVAQRVNALHITSPTTPAPPQSSRTQRQHELTHPFHDSNAEDDSAALTVRQPDAQGPIASAVAPIRLGSIEVLSRPAGAQVVLEGRVVGQTPLVIEDVREGTHSVHIEAPGFIRWATSVRVTGGARTRIGASLEGESPLEQTPSNPNTDNADRLPPTAPD